MSVDFSIFANAYPDHFQLQDAKTTLDENTKASVAHSSELHQRARQFKSQQIDIDRRLMIVTQSETSDDAVRRFDSSMESLRKLDVAQEYMTLLTEVENLRSMNYAEAMVECIIILTSCMQH